MNLDDFMGYMITNGKVDDSFGLIPDCPECGDTLIKTDNRDYPYYCSNCKKFFSKDLSKSEYVGISLKKEW